MKNLNFRTAGWTGLAAVVLLWAAPAGAQTHVLRFGVPFQFAAGNQMLPAGQYEVAFDQFARILLRNTGETTVHFLPLSTPYQKRSPADLTGSTLRFEQYAGTMVLTAVWAPGYENGRTVRASGRVAETMKGGLNSPARVQVNASLE